MESNLTVRKFGLPLVADATTEVLVMGTLASELSVRKQQYYANPDDDFWRLIGLALNENIEMLSYDDRLTALKSRRVGLWDTHHNSVRDGDLGSETTHPELNDFTVLKTAAPRLKLVCFNGQSAANSGEKIRALGYKTHVLPSSSGSNRRNSDKRFRLWNSALSAL